MRFVARFCMKQITRKLIIIVKSVLFKEQHWNVGVGLPISMHGCYFWRDPESNYSITDLFLYTCNRPALLLNLTVAGTMHTGSHNSTFILYFLPNRLANVIVDN